ncbi:hypothetical protein ACVIWU_004843 [Bradyrhizobium sp. USDA 4509]|uniref:Tyr recombinase domain-containing protein n=1 Tax=Bradyrhizobium brasilense TaxID=1419277 RepID=A0ABY8JS57_9BRAD|nr:MULTISPECIES: hypothetical protein [Bradyrhizobium]WFU68395.1 hypothetical protein QA636_27830 [Bradyrhizobium brasilense]
MRSQLFDAEWSKTVGFDSHSLRHFYATALHCIQLFESTANPPKIYAMLRDSSLKPVVFHREFGGGVFRHCTAPLSIPLSEATAKNKAQRDKPLWLAVALLGPRAAIRLDTALIMAADTISGYPQGLLDNFEFKQIS